ncbi:MAG: branched-chain amino acid ABC transporter permease [Acidimicrobiia bacterium]
MGRLFVAGIVQGSIYGLLALGIVLVYKGSRVLNFAQGEFGGFALFVSWTLIERWKLPWALGALVGVLSAVVIALVFERLIVRRMANASRLAIAVATVGLFLLLVSLELVVWKQAIAFLRPPITGTSVMFLGYPMSPVKMLAIGALLTIGVGAAAFLRYTDFGLGVLAASQDVEATRLVGIKVSRVSAFTWGSAAALGAIAALLVEPIVGNFAPGSMTEFFIRGLAAALVGGLTSLPGAFVGGLSVGIAEAFAVRLVGQTTFPAFYSVVMLVIIIAILLLRPAGLMGKRA